MFDRPPGAGVTSVPARFHGLRIYGPQTGSGAGTSVASAGDLNGDGRPDVAIGAPGPIPAFKPKGPRTAGAAYVVYGRTRTGIVDLARLGAGGFSFSGAALGDRTGDGIAAGPLLQPGAGTSIPSVPDIVVGAPRASRARGAVYVVPAVPVIVSDRSIRVSRSGRAAVQMRCILPRGLRCFGAVRIRPVGSRTQIGRRAFSIPGGHRLTKQILLSSSARRQLARNGSMRVRVTASTPVDSSGPNLTGYRNAHPAPALTAGAARSRGGNAREAAAVSNGPTSTLRSPARLRLAASSACPIFGESRA